MKFQAIFALAAVFLLALPSIADAQSTGTVRFKVAKAGFIIGVGGGTGTLTFKGRTHPLRVDGIGAGTVGVTSAGFWSVQRQICGPRRTSSVHIRRLVPASQSPVAHEL